MIKQATDLQHAQDLTSGDDVQHAIHTIPAGLKLNRGDDTNPKRRQR
jgi:hypothetical protein